MARERSTSAGAEKDSKDSIVKQTVKPGVTTSTASGNRGRERERRRRGGSASSSSSSSGSSSSSSSSSRSSSGSGSRSSSTSSSSGSSTSSTSSSGSDRGGARGAGGGSTRGTGRKAISTSPRRSKSPISGNKVNARKDSKDRNSRRSKDRSRRSTDRDANTDLAISKKNSKDHGRSSRTRSRSPITRSPRRGGRNADSHTTKRRERSPTPRPIRIHVGRLTRNVTKEHVMEIFSCFGEVKHVEFPVDRNHQNFGRGIAYVEYSTPEDCEKAMKQMDGGQIDGQEVTCSPVHPQKAFPPIRRKTPPPMRRPRWRTPPFNRFNNRGGGNFRSPIRRRSPRRRSRSPIRRRRRSASSDSSR